MAPKSKTSSAPSAESSFSSGGGGAAGGGKATNCGERDVLMGRGKRISEWPGNIHFRQVINKYRDEYHQCSRKEKVKIANAVLEDITKVGGRFLQQIKGDQWEEVDYERAIEKACQALREKEKSRPPETSPFGKEKTKGIKPPKAPPTVRPATAQRRPAKTVLAMKKRKLKAKNNHRQGEDGQSTSTEESTSADESGNEEQTDEEESDSEVDSTGKVMATNSRELPDERMVPLLEAFVKKHGHCAVPPWDCLNTPANDKSNSDRDDDDDDHDHDHDHDADHVLLANWCTVQRQIYREIQSAYRQGTQAENARIEKLNELGFVWDYEVWHWEQSYDFVKDEIISGAEKKRGLSDRALVWIREQRIRGKRGMPHDPNERAKKLKAIDVLIV